jgi:hypothetical protein
MSVTQDTLDLLEGPIGWLVVAAVGALVVYIGIKAIESEGQCIGSKISDDIQGLQDWFNQCLFASKPGGCVVKCALAAATPPPGFAACSPGASTGCAMC